MSGKMRFGMGRPGVSGLLKKGFKHYSGVEVSALAVRECTLRY